MSIARVTWLRVTTALVAGAAGLSGSASALSAAPPAAPPSASVTTLHPNQDVSLGPWVKETGSGTPIYTEIDEGVSTPDNTGIKVTSASSPVGASQFNLADMPTTVTGVGNPSGAWSSASPVYGGQNGIAYANGYWVTVGEGGSMQYATDPAGPWTTGIQGSSRLYAVAYGNGYWVAVGINGTLYYKAGTPEGAWTANTQGTATFRAVTYANGYWVAVGPSNTIRYATVPTGAWAQKTFTGSGRLYNSVAYGNGYWVIAGASGATRYATSPSGTWTLNAQGSDSFYSVAYGNGYWVAMTSLAPNPAVLYYKSGAPTGAWTKKTLSGTTGNSIAFGNGYFVGTGRALPGTATNGSVFYATDPSATWTVTTTPALESLGSVAFGADGYWLAAGVNIFLSNPLMVYKAPAVTSATLNLRGRQTGRTDDTSLVLTAKIFKADGTTQVGAAVNLTVTTQTTYLNAAGTLDAAAFSALTKTELNGLRIQFTATKTTAGAGADTVTWYVDAAELALAYG